jgi:hypothetical protein
MSKIITKRQLNTLIESTLKEYSNDVPGNMYNMDLDEFCSHHHNMDKDICQSHFDHKNDRENQSNQNGTRMSQEDITSATNHVDYMKEDKMCESCGGMMAENICEDCGGMNYMKEGSYMKEDELEEGNAFSGALETARKEGKTEFEFNGKTYPVEGEDKVKESVKDLAESVTKTFNPSFLTENMDNFNKLINYRNK